MSARYENGKAISKNVLQALRYAAKVGVMTKAMWYENFSHGTKRWKQKQLQNLLRQSFLKLHTCELGDFFVIGDRGIKLAKELEWSCVDPALPRQIRHDESIGRGVLKLARTGLCQSWFTEKELKTGNFSDYTIKDTGGKTKYPDSIFKYLMRDKYRTVALEYERTGKTVPRYRSILWSYNAITSIAMVLFVVEDDSIKKRIKRSMKYLGNVQVVERVAFMDVKEWNLNPLTATIELRTKKTSFEKLSAKIPA